MTYNLVCDQGHPAETFTVTADSDDQAVEMMLAQEKSHVGSKHPEMTMTDDQAREYIKSHWTKG